MCMICDCIPSMRMPMYYTDTLYTQYLILTIYCSGFQTVVSNSQLFKLRTQIHQILTLTYFTKKLLSHYRTLFFSVGMCDSSRVYPNGNRGHWDSANWGRVQKSSWSSRTTCVHFGTRVKRFFMRTRKLSMPLMRPLLHRHRYHRVSLG